MEEVDKHINGSKEAGPLHLTNCLKIGNLKYSPTMCWPSYTRVATLYNLPYCYSNIKNIEINEPYKNTHTYMFMYISLALVYLLWLNDFKSNV